MRALLITLTFVTLVTGCIGAESGEPPVVGIRNMYNQPRYDTQERQPFFADQRSMRPGVDGTVSRESEHFLHWATGRNAKGDAWLAEVPAPLIARHGGSPLLLARGQERYNIYCAACHSISGDGKGMVSRRAQALGASGLVAPTFHDDSSGGCTSRRQYWWVRNGVRNMPSYAHNIPVDDRWAIVHYVRALQLSQAPAAAPENTEQSQ